MVKRTIEFDGRQVAFKASAAIPRIYRAKFGRDIFRDLMQLEKEIKKSERDKDDEQDAASTIPISNLELFENVAYVMAKHADPSQPDTAEEWLDQFDTFSIYQVLPEIIDMWRINTATQVKSKKKLNEVAAK